MSSILGSNSGNMGSPYFHELKKHASFFIKEKIKTARLALTDVTPAQLLVEEATNGNPGAPETRTLKMISRAAFEIDDYWRIVEILHKRFNWGLNVRKKSERITKLLDNRPLLKDERNIARSITRGIEGFGSFCSRTSSDLGVLHETSQKSYAKCNSQFNEHGNQENNISLVDDQYFSNGKLETSQHTNSGISNLAVSKKMENSISWNNSDDQWMLGKESARTNFKENMTPKWEVQEKDLDEWDTTEETNALLSKQDDSRMNMSMEDDHPFNLNEHLNSVSLLSSRDCVLRAF